MKNLLLTVMLFAGNILMYAQFTCDSSMYLGQAPNAATNTTLYGINTSTNPLTYPAIGTIASIKYNAMGFHPATGYLYAMADASNNILRINSDGTYVNLGAVTNLPTGVMYNAGEIDSAGNFYVSASGTVNTLYRINIATLTATAIPLLSSLTVSDFAYNPIDGFLYGVHNTTGFLTRINTATGAVTTIGTAAAGTPFGAMMGSSTGAVYGVSNNGGFYQFNLTTGSRVLISGSPASLGNDGAHCVTAPITFSADLSITKTNGTTTYTAGTTTTYTIVARNNGPFGVLNASVTDSVPVGIPNANMTYTAVASAGSTTAVTGTQTGAINDLVSLPVNGTVTYTVTVNIPAGFTGNLTNTATITSPITSTDTNLSNNSATDTDVSACSIGTDSDGDGIADFCDLDDDNDGILDTDECGAYNRISNGTFPTTGGDTNTVPGWIVGGTYAGSGPWASPTGRVNLNSMGLEFRRDASTVTTLAQNLTNVFGNSTINLNNLYWNRTAFNGSVTTFIFTISYAGTVYATITGASNTPTITASNGASVNLSTLQTITTGAPPNGTLSTPVNLTITLPSSVPINGDLLFTFNAGTEPTQVNDLGFASVSLLTCKDTDSDGIPDYLDLFSDTDGCSDAVEGDENVTVSQLNPNGSINVATTGGINTFGVPNLVNSGGAADIGGDQGQGVGFSQSALFNECDSTSGFDCIKPGVAGTPLPTKVGILTKSNPSTQWPQNVPNGHIVLDGAEKGFVITHMTTAQRDALVPVEGMMIYNTTVNCVQLYRGTTPSVDSGRTGWNCLETACDGLPQRNVNVGYWGASGFNFFSGHPTFRNQLQTTTNYGSTGTFKGVSGWTWIDANTDINATAATFTAAQMKAKYDMIVTGYNNMTAASAAKIKEYTDLGGVVFVLADGLQSAGNALNTAFGGTGNISNGSDAQAGTNAQARTLNNAISNGIFGIGGGATIIGVAGQAVPPVANIPAGSFITAYMNFPSATSTTNAGVYITGASGRAIFVYDEGIYRAGAVAGTVIDTPQEIFIHNLMSYALQKIGFSAQ